MSLDSLRLIRDILLRTVAVCFAITLFSALCTLTLWDTWSALVCRWYHTTPEFVGQLILSFYASVKFYYIFVLLAPALALHWTIKAQEKRA